MCESLLETGMIEHCAPTLAGIKTASLFSYFFENRRTAGKELSVINETINSRGVFVEALLWREKSVLIYVYRPTLLQADLNRLGVMDLLEKYGYTDCNMKNCISWLKCRLYQYDCFPHEIGIFLGYPLEDVEGFIENKGKNCKSCGMWKVYCNEYEKKKLFEKFKKCTEVYKCVFAGGRRLTQMTVATT